MCIRDSVHIDRSTLLRSFQFSLLHSTGTEHEVHIHPIFRDIDGVEGITDNDKTEIGKGIADYTYGITLNAAWKGLDVYKRQPQRSCANDSGRKMS